MELNYSHNIKTLGKNKNELRSRWEYEKYAWEENMLQIKSMITC